MRRTSIRNQARVTRASGESVTLLISTAATASTDTPLQASRANRGPTAGGVRREGPIYAHVSWHNLDDAQFGEGGRTVRRSATVEFSVEYLDLGRQAYAVELGDGSVMQKQSENLSDDQSTYSMKVEGYVNIQQ